MLTIGDIGNPACWGPGRASPPCWTWRTPAWSDPSAASSAADPASRPALSASPGIFGQRIISTKFNTPVPGTVLYTESCLGEQIWKQQHPDSTFSNEPGWNFKEINGAFNKTFKFSSFLGILQQIFNEILIESDFYIFTQKIEIWNQLWSKSES